MDLLLSAFSAAKINAQRSILSVFNRHDKLPLCLVLFVSLYEVDVTSCKGLICKHICSGSWAFVSNDMCSVDCMISYVCLSVRYAFVEPIQYCA